MRLLSKIIVKDVSEDTCFILDLEDDEDSYLKCVDVFAQLIKHIQHLENFTESGLLEFLKTKYADVQDSDLKRDVGAFITFLKEKKFLAE
jgi:hypothetical protein